jgi:protein TonB
MSFRAQALLYGASLVAHAGIALGVSVIRPPAPRPPLQVTMVSQPRPEPPPPQEAPEPEPPPPEPEAPPPVEPTPTPRPAREPSPPRAETVAVEAPAPAPAPATPPPDFGIAMAGTGPGIAVPSGSPDGVPGGDPSSRRAREVTRTLEAQAEPTREQGCAEEATRPRPIAMPSPEYTEAARTAEIEGRVRVEIHVDATGAVTDARVLASLDPGLDEAALVAARAARFEPARRCGEAVEATFTIAIRFQL